MRRNPYPLQWPPRLALDDDAPARKQFPASFWASQGLEPERAQWLDHLETEIAGVRNQQQECSRRFADLLRAARCLWPDRGTGAKGWGQFLARVGVDDSTAVRIMSGRARRARSPVVYFVQAIDGGPIKIGTSTDIKDRIRDLQQGSHSALRLIAIAPGNRSDERALHASLAAHALGHEWFMDVQPVRDAMLMLPGVKIL